MSETHYCIAGGYLVDDDHWLPVEAYEDRWAGHTLVTGCNNLRCDRCGRQVTSVVAPGMRVYHCDCQRVEVTANQSVGQPLDPFTGETLPWNCAGHPVLSLPATVDGREIPAKPDWVQLARGSFTGALRPVPHRDTLKRRGFLIQRLYQMMARQDANPIGAAAATLLTDSDPIVRAEAIIFFDSCSTAPGGVILPTLVAITPSFLLAFVIRVPRPLPCSIGHSNRSRYGLLTTPPPGGSPHFSIAFRAHT